MSCIYQKKHCLRQMCPSVIAEVISSNVKAAEAGATLDVPLGHKNDLWSFLHLGMITVSVLTRPARTRSSLLWPSPMEAGESARLQAATDRANECEVVGDAENVVLLIGKVRRYVYACPSLVASSTLAPAAVIPWVMTGSRRTSPRPHTVPM
jgi:Amino acid synthesis